MKDILKDRLKEKDISQDLLQELLANLSSEQLLKQLLRQMQREQCLELTKLVSLFQEAKQEAGVPLSLFAQKMPPAGALCKYLKENKQFSNKEIAGLLNRDQKSIWGSYQRAKKKKLWKQGQKQEAYYLPISIFSNRSLSLLESVVLHLHQTYNLTNPQIAKLLHKSPNSMAVLLKRAKEKNE